MEDASDLTAQLMSQAAGLLEMASTLAVEAPASGAAIDAMLSAVDDARHLLVAAQIITRRGDRQA